MSEDCDNCGERKELSRCQRENKRLKELGQRYLDKVTEVLEAIPDNKVNIGLAFEFQEAKKDFVQALKEEPK